MADPYLSIKGARTWFPTRDGKAQVRAVDGVTLDVHEGEVLGLVGESGCGKTTLARTILQLVPATEGSIRWKGIELTELKGAELRNQRKNWQIIFQDPYGSLNPRFTVQDTLSEAIRQKHKKLSKADLKGAVGALLEQVGLSPQHAVRYPHEFSGGQRQRIAIARALATEPGLIVADEPVSALDVSVQAQILNLLGDIRRERSLTMIFVSHDLSVVHYLADRIAVMLAGQVVELGSADQIYDNPQHPYTRQLLSAVPKFQRRETGSLFEKMDTPNPQHAKDEAAKPEPVYDEIEPGHFVAQS